MEKPGVIRCWLRPVMSVVFLIVFFFGFFYPAFAAKPISEGSNLPTFTFSAPDSDENKQYLGLKRVASFVLSEVPAKIILLQVFYVLCQECQKQAPDMNTIYDFIRNDPELNKNIKIVGIGIRGNREKLRAFKTTFRIKFPLIPDTDNTFYSQIGEPPIPFLMLVNNNGRVLLTHVGPLKDVEQFFGQIKNYYTKNQ